MAVKHRTGIGALNALLDAADASPDRVRPPFAAIDHAAMTAAELEGTYAMFTQAERAGAIEIRYERVGLARQRPSKVVLADADKLAAFLGRPRAATKAADAAAEILRALPELPGQIKVAFDLMCAAWARSKSWRRLEPGDIDGARQAFQLAGALLERDHSILIDERSFSVRACGDTKALQKRRDTILAILIESHAAKPDTTLESFGVTAFPEPVQLRGPVVLRLARCDLALDLFDPSAAIPPEQVDLVALSGAPHYLITIENKTSFQRYVRQIRDGSLVIFTSGFLSDPCARLIAKLASPNVPWFHWGDIDAGGLTIFHGLEEKIARPAGIKILPHMMTREIALAHGAESPERDTRLNTIANSQSAVADIARWLAEDAGARILEQEMLDPKAPQLLSSAPNVA
jgi:hypothetical protein